MKSFKQNSKTTKDELLDNEKSEQVDNAAKPTQENVTTPIIEITTNLSVQDLNPQVDKSPLSPRRRLSSSAKLTRQSNSISGIMSLLMIACTICVN